MLKHLVFVRNHASTMSTSTSTSTVSLRAAAQHHPPKREARHHRPAMEARGESTTGVRNRLSELNHSRHSTVHSAKNQADCKR